MNVITISTVLPLGQEPPIWDRGVRVGPRENLFDVDYDGLTILFANIGTAGTLCTAFMQGGASCSCDGPNDKDAVRAGFPAVHRGSWYPGCGRDVLS